VGAAEDEAAVCALEISTGIRAIAATITTAKMNQGARDSPIGGDTS
jgi:hypothetical protein